MPKSDWLDSMAFRKMAEIHAVRLCVFNMILQYSYSEGAGGDGEVGEFIPVH